MNSSSVGGFSSQPRCSSGQHPHLVAGAAHQHRLDLVVAEHVAAQPAPPSGSGGMSQCAMNGARRNTELCPQWGPQSACHQALPMV